MWVGSMDQKDRLEGELATHSCILAWKIPWPEEPSGVHVVHEVTNSRTRLSRHTVSSAHSASSGQR